MVNVGGCSSKCFSVANGVPQVGILSPWLLYIDDLSVSLSNANAGCNFGGMYVNHFAYADDMAIDIRVTETVKYLRKLCY